MIFNPSAKGDKARRFRKQLDQIGSQAALKLTTAPGDARRLAGEAVREGFEVVVAAGGDGTVNEVLNGMGDVPGGFERACLGVLPLGTVNVFARELGIPTKPAQAWAVIRQGRERRIDLPLVEFSGKGQRERRYFVQLAGAGLDARAIELVSWGLKKRIGPLAYVFAGLQALLGPAAAVTAKVGDRESTGGLVLIGNGRLYGGPYRLFPNADLRDGLLDICVFPRVNWMTLAQCGPHLLLRNCVPASATKLFQASSLDLTSAVPGPLEVDGELIGHLPASFSIKRDGLRVIAP